MAAPHPRPRVITTLRPGPGMYRRHVDVAADPALAADLPVMPGGRIVLTVEFGLHPEDAAVLIQVARRIRTAAVVEIRGRTPNAVTHREFRMRKPSHRRRMTA